MRIGQNPAKTVDTVIQPMGITVAIVTYVPTMGGYYAQSLEVLKVCLNSIWKNTQVPFDLMVFDNASCTEVREYLIDQHRKGNIQYLVLSDKNLGKAGAWNFIFGAAPGQYIAYADSDVYHYPGWLSKQIEVLETIPGIGMVTGMPMWTPEEFSTATIEWATTNPSVKIERGKILSWDDYWRHSRSLGADETKARAHFESAENIVVTYQGNRYYVGAAHFQFVAPKTVLKKILPIPSTRPMGQVRNLDIALNDQGYLRFSTPDWWVRHMGNTLETEHLGDEASVTDKKGRKNALHLWRFKGARRIAAWVYHKSFEILYKDERRSP